MPLLLSVLLELADGDIGGGSAQKEFHNRREVPRNLSGQPRLLEGVEAIVVRAQRGDPDAVEQLVTELAPYVGRICASIALHAGEDALQEALIAIVRNLRSLREPAALWGWARTIAVREAMRVARPGHAVAVDPRDLDTISLRDTDATGVDVRQVLESLPPHHRAVLVLRDLEGLSEAETADVLGVSLGTVKSRTARARDAFLRRWTT
jgi:RNA polymerase sigma factor (sigma-70 family)